jgi:2-polyprenyl-3-methyl-5-hydroxy-6-metoxy-1,4-benzoquinol methylase
LLHLILDLGQHPLSNGLLQSRSPEQLERRYPLQLAVCQECTLLQVTETVPPEVLYQQDYPYFSSSSPALLAHAEEIAEKLIAQRNLHHDSFVVEVASNDGYLLRNFVRKGIPCLGIDPAKGPADRAQSIGIPVINDFFSTGLADRLVHEGKLADVIIANNVIAHVDAINDFVAAFARLLKPDGVAVFECAYAVDMIESCEFDTIYHEHLFYHTLHSLTPLFGRHGLVLVDAERLPIHGGSLRVHVARRGKQSPTLQSLMDAERRLGCDELDWYRGFSERVSSHRESLVACLKAEKQRGNRIACYGAAAKGSTLVNYLDLGPDFFEYVVDANPHKQGKFMPGQHVPIVHPDRLLETLPEVVLLLVWNFAGEVLRQQAAYRAAGGRFLIPIPEPTFVEPWAALENTAFAIGSMSRSDKHRRMASAD